MTELSILQNVRLSLLGSVLLGKEKRPGWLIEKRIYAFRCPEHGVVESPRHGYDETLRCPKCRLGEGLG